MVVTGERRGLRSAYCHCPVGPAMDGVQQHGAYADADSALEPTAGWGHPLTLSNDWGLRWIGLPQSTTTTSNECHWRQSWCPWSMLLSTITMKSEIHVDGYSLGCCLMPWWDTLIWVACVTTWGHVEVNGPVMAGPCWCLWLCYHWSPHGCQWLGLLPEAKLITMGTGELTLSLPGPQHCDRWWPGLQRASPALYQLLNSSLQPMTSAANASRESLIFPWEAGH